MPIILPNIYRKIRDNGIIWTFKRIFNKTIEAVRTPFIKKRALRALRKAASKPCDENHVVFVCERLHLRAIKIAYALKEIGWKVTLLHKEPLSFAVSEYFCEIRQFKTPWDAFLIATSYSPIAYHVFSNWNFEIASIFIRYKPGKIIFDNMDLLTGMVKDAVLKRYPGQAELEQYCYKNADGLCCRDLRVQYLKKHLHYKLPPRILFQEYCWPIEKIKRKAKLTDGIHIVYVGNLELNPDNPVGYQYELASLLSKHGIHFHIYPFSQELVNELKRIMIEYLKKDGNYDFVHIHDTIPADKLSSELSQYHCGLLISTKNVNYGDDHDTSYDHVSNYFCAAKVFDYMDAGLFVITQNGRFLKYTVERHNNGKIVNSLKEIVDYCINNGFISMPSIPSSYYLSSNISRLATFYSAIKEMNSSCH